MMAFVKSTKKERKIRKISRTFILHQRCKEFFELMDEMGLEKKLQKSTQFLI